MNLKAILIIMAVLVTVGVSEAYADESDFKIFGNYKQHVYNEYSQIYEQGITNILIKSTCTDFASMIYDKFVNEYTTNFEKHEFGEGAVLAKGLCIKVMTNEANKDISKDTRENSDKIKYIQKHNTKISIIAAQDCIDNNKLSTHTCNIYLKDRPNQDWFQDTKSKIYNNSGQITWKEAYQCVKAYQYYAGQCENWLNPYQEEENRQCRYFTVYQGEELICGSYNLDKFYESHYSKSFGPKVIWIEK